MADKEKSNGCTRCGRCCMSAIIRLPDIKPNDGTGFAEWLANHRCDIMNVPDEQGGEYLSLRIPLLCMYLCEHPDNTFSCRIYDKRPEICRSYICKAAQKAK